MARVQAKTEALRPQRENKHGPPVTHGLDAVHTRLGHDLKVHAQTCDGVDCPVADSLKKANDQSQDNQLQNWMRQLHGDADAALADAANSNGSA